VVLVYRSAFGSARRLVDSECFRCLTSGSTLSYRPRVVLFIASFLFSMVLIHLSPYQCNNGGATPEWRLAFLEAVPVFILVLPHVQQQLELEKSSGSQWKYIFLKIPIYIQGSLLIPLIFLFARFVKEKASFSIKKLVCTGPGQAPPRR